MAANGSKEKKEISLPSFGKPKQINSRRLTRIKIKMKTVSEKVKYFPILFLIKKRGTRKK